MRRDPTNVPQWTADVETSFEEPQDILRGVIAAYSLRIDGATPHEAAQIEAKQAEYARQLATLNPTNEAALATIVETYPARLESVRQGNSSR